MSYNLKFIQPLDDSIFSKVLYKKASKAIDEIIIDIKEELDI